MKLEKGESILFEEGASHFHNYLAVGGSLVLTNRRIFFKSHSFVHDEHVMTIDLHFVSDIQFFKTLFLNPSGLAILLKNGQMENFIVDDRRVWQEKIRKVISQPA